MYVCTDQAWQDPFSQCMFLAAMDDRQRKGAAIQSRVAPQQCLDISLP